MSYMKGTETNDTKCGVPLSVTNHCDGHFTNRQKRLRALYGKYLNEYTKIGQVLWPLKWYMDVLV